MQNNPQFLRTDKAIKQALINLLTTKSFDKITVQDILDETPVTRSTFYKHFHDKYEVAERIQEDFFASQEEISAHVHKNSTLPTPALTKLSKQNNEIMEALLKIHTESVDLRRTLVKQCADHYLTMVESPTAKIEAEIYAQVITAFRLRSPRLETFSFEYMNEIYISVFLRLLGISDDEELRKALRKKAAKLPSGLSEI